MEQSTVNPFLLPDHYIFILFQPCLLRRDCPGQIKVLVPHEYLHELIAWLFKTISCSSLSPQVCRGCITPDACVTKTVYCVIFVILLK